MILKLCSKRWKVLPFGHYLESSLQIVELLFFLFLGKVCVCGHDYCTDDACVCSDGGACSFVTSRVG